MRDQDFPRRRCIRLERSVYANPNAIFSVTICVKHRSPLFQEKAVTERYLASLRELATFKRVLIYSYCFMPDHLHLLLSPSQACDLVEFVRLFKGRTGRMAQEQGWRGAIWQRGFYDHALRREEDVRTVARYIVENPVREALVDDWRQYPFSGSFVWDDLS